MLHMVLFLVGTLAVTFVFATVQTARNGMSTVFGVPIDLLWGIIGITLGIFYRHSGEPHAIYFAIGIGAGSHYVTRLGSAFGWYVFVRNRGRGTATEILHRHRERLRQKAKDRSQSDSDG